MAWEPDYVSLDEIKSVLRIEDNIDDVPLAFAVASASRAIDRTAGRQFGSVDSLESRVYIPEWDGSKKEYVLEIDDVQDVTGMVVEADGFVLSADDYSLGPLNADKKNRPWTTIRTSNTVTTVTVTALFGWSAVPDGVKQACLLQASRIFARKNSPFGVAGSPETGSELRLLNKVDADVEVVLGPFKRWWAVA